MTLSSPRLFFPYAVSAGAGISIISCAVSWIDSPDESSKSLLGVSSTWICILVTVSFLVGILRYARNVSQLEFPGPVPFPLLGNVMSLIEKGIVQESIRSLVSIYGNVVDLLLLDGYRIVLVNDATFCKTVMKSMDRGDLNFFHQENNNKWSLPQIFWSHRRFREKLVWQELWGNESLDLFSRSDRYLDWKSHRRLLQPAFDQKHVRAMESKIEKCVNNLVSNLPTGTTFDVMPYLVDYGLDMIHSTAFGVSLSDLPDRGRFVVEFLTNSTKLFVQYLFDPFPYFSSRVLPVLGLNPRENQRRMELPAFRQYCRQLLEKEQKRQEEDEQRRIYSDDGTTKEQEEENNGPARDNLLSLMVARLNDDDFKVENGLDELVAFLFAGYDTTAATLGNLIYELASNRTAQVKVHDELDNAFQNWQNSNNNQNNSGEISPPSYADIIQYLPYLSACIRESQRLQPVAPVLNRRLHQDTTLNYKDTSGVQQKTLIGKGTVVFVPTFLLHRDEEQYPDPEVFRPERWIRKDDNNVDCLIPVTPGYYFAFGAGPKMCVGFQLAEKEVKMAAASIFNSFIVTSREKRDIVDSFTTGPEKLMCDFQARKKVFN